MKKILYYFELIRWQNIILTIFSIFVYLLLANKLSHNLDLTLLIVVICLSLASGNIINDYYDLAIDKINKPNRPIPSGRITAKSALYLYFCLSLIIFLFLFNYNTTVFLLVSFNNILLFFYSKKFKAIALIGNVIVSYLSASIFILLALYFYEMDISLFFITSTFFIHLLRELVKDMEDIEGDRRYMLSTFPLKYGIKASLILFHILSAVFLLLLSYLILIYKIQYLQQILFLILIFIPLVLMNFWSRTYLLKADVFKKISFYLKVEMLLGLLLIYVSFYDFR
jgi:geranylgeranylglycerol-phosphate geranylgeranyltransferase